MRRTVWLAAAVALAAAAGWLAWSSADAVLRRSVESLGTALTGVDVSVADADLSLPAGSGRLGELRIANPPGFGSGSALAIDEVRFHIEPSTLAAGPLVVDDVSIGPPRVHVEIDGRGVANFHVIDAHARRADAGARVGAVRLVVRRIAFADGTVRITAPAITDASLEAPLHGFVLTDLGSPAEPTTAAAVGARLERELAHRIAVAVATTEIDRLVSQKLGRAARSVTDALLPRPAARPVEDLIGGALDAGAGLVGKALRSAD